jgi:hypothetical protein
MTWVDVADKLVTGGLSALMTWLIMRRDAAVGRSVRPPKMPWREARKLAREIERQAREEQARILAELEHDDISGELERDTLRPRRGDDP